MAWWTSFKLTAGIGLILGHAETDKVPSPFWTFVIVALLVFTARDVIDYARGRS